MKEGHEPVPHAGPERHPGICDAKTNPGKQRCSQRNEQRRQRQGDDHRGTRHDQCYNSNNRFHVCHTPAMSEQ